MSKLGGAIAEGAQLIEQLYLSFYQELQKPLLAGDAAKADSDMHTHRQMGQSADSAARNGAVAKVAHYLSFTQLFLLLILCAFLNEVLYTILFILIYAAMLDFCWYNMSWSLCGSRRCALLVCCSSIYLWPESHYLIPQPLSCCT